MYGKHYQTGETMPDALIQKIQESGHFNQGFATVEYVAAALLDMDWYSNTEVKDFDISAFETRWWLQCRILRVSLGRSTGC